MVTFKFSILAEDGAYAYEAVKDILKEEEPSIHTRMTKEDVLLAKDGLLEPIFDFFPPPFFSEKKPTHTYEGGLPKQQKMPEILFCLFSTRGTSV